MEDDIIKKFKFRIFVLLILFFLILLVNTVAAEDNLTINSTVNGNFDSIQSMIDNAKSGDSIHLENKTYVSNGSSISINKDINIYGVDCDKTVLDGDFKSKILVISNKVNVNIYGITFINGKTGGNGAAIDNSGYLTVHDSKFINNSADYGGIRTTGGSLTVYNSAFENNYGDGGGAAIDSYFSNTMVINCTFVKNHSHEGGAIYNRFSEIELIDSNFINNSATRGGGIYNNRGHLIVRNSKFYSNSASHLGGGVKSWGVCEIYDSDVRNNSAEYGGGIYISEFTMHVSNTIVENNVAKEGGGLISDSFGNLIITDSIINNNRAEDGGGISSSCGQLTATNCILNNNVATNNGGGIFSTLGEIAGVKFACNLKNIVLNNNLAKYGGGLCFGSILGTFEDVTLYNNSASEGGAIHNTGNLSFNKFTIDSNTADTGGAVYNTGTLNIINSNLNHNCANYDGAIYNSGNLNLINSNFNYNSANKGAIYNKANLNITDSIIENNNAKTYGGVIYNSANLDISNSNFNYNSAEYGGVIYNDGSYASIYNSSFEMNTAERGAVIQTLSNVSINNSRFQKNIITHTLGVIAVIKGNIDIFNSIFEYNTGSDEGGVIFNVDGTVFIDNSQFSSNKALSHGGAIDNNAKLTVINSLFDNNQAYGAGAIDNGGNLTVINSKFTNNKATKNGGAIDNNNILNIVGSVFDNNVAGGYGGAIIARKDINIDHSALFDNKASVADAVYVNNDNSNLTGNWWGLNNPDFEELFNFDISDNFTWIILNFNTVGEVMQYENSNFMFDMGEIKNKNNQIFKLNSSELLPDLDIAVSNGDKFVIQKGYLSKSMYVGSIQIISFTLDGQSFSVNVLSNPSKIIDNKNIVEDYNGKTTFKVKVIGKNGNAVGANEIVVMKIAGKTYNVKTDKNGFATKILSLTPGKYTITSIYKGSTVKNTITIKKVLKAKNKVVKKSKKIKYSATLKTSKGKAIKGKIITFKIKGKTYLAKTNKKGVATVKFKNLKAGNYKITVKYLNSQVKTLLKVKK